MRSIPPTTPLRTIRLCLLAGASAFGVLAAGQSLHFGNSPSRAAAGGLNVMLGTVVAWEIYHGITRKRNGLAAMILPYAGFPTRLRAHQETDLMENLTVSILLGIIVGLVVLVPGIFSGRRRDKPAPPDHPMADANLDASSPG